MRKHPSRKVSLRQEKLRKGEGDVTASSETFRRNPVGNQSHPAKSSPQPEASLASCPAMARAKRRQPASRPCDGAPRVLPAGAFVLDTTGATAARRRARRAAPTGVEEQGIVQQGSPGTWEALRLPLDTRGVGAARPQSSWPQAGVGPDGRARTQRTGGYRRANRKEAWWEGRRESEHLIVPLKQGNASRADPGEGRGCLVVDLSAGSQCQDLCLDTLSTESRTDSVAAVPTTARRAGCVNWARPDLWEPQEATAGATRPSNPSFLLAPLVFAGPLV